MIDKEKLIKDLENKIQDFYFNSDMRPNQLFVFRDNLNKIIDDLKSGHYDVDKYESYNDDEYRDDEDV